MATITIPKQSKYFKKDVSTGDETVSASPVVLTGIYVNVATATSVTQIETVAGDVVIELAAGIAAGTMLNLPDIAMADLRIDRVGSATGEITIFYRDI